MPELPEVELFKRSANACVGRVVKRVLVRDSGSLAGISPAALKRRLEGKRLSAVRRHGKHLFVEFSRADCLAMHFGINGSLRLVAEGEPEPASTRLELEFADDGRLAYVNPRRIGNVRIAPDVGSFVTKSNLGPDALDPHFDVRALANLIAGRKRDIKSILMDQELIAGIGNIYSDEILFQARIHAGTAADALDKVQIETLFAKLKQVLKTAIEKQAGSETSLERMPKGYLLRERHAGGHCPRCGTALATLKRSGRTCYYCPRCQKR